MIKMNAQQVIDQTKKWIIEVVVGCNFCPFAANALHRNRVFYQVESSTSPVECLEAFLAEMKRLDHEVDIETSFLIFPNAFENFDEYLDLVFLAEELLIEKGYEGIYQVASFHPLYRFANAEETDPENYTNRSVYPMMHLLREESIDIALEHYKHPEKIPERNIDFAREKGLTYMKMLRDACMHA